MNMRIKQALVASAILAGAAALTGCYESDSSIISAADSVMPIQTGHYCQYDFLQDQRSWDTTCNTVVISSPSANTYLVVNNELNTRYTVHIDGKPLDSGDLGGNYLAEACWDDSKDGKGCYIGTLRIFDSQTFHWVFPACSSPSEGDDPCKLNSEQAARVAFASATTWGTDDLRKYVWMSK